MVYKFVAQSRPECEDFLQICAKDGQFLPIDKFFELYPNATEDSFLNTCVIRYRGREINYKDYADEYCAFSKKMDFAHFQKPTIILNQSVSTAAYFTRKAIECLQFARFFTMKSALLIDTDYNMHWSQGYVPQFLFRCIYFGTSTTWFSNAFDHVLQSVYWGKELFTSVKDRNDQSYDSSWDVKKVLENCTYEFVVGELKTRGMLDCRKHLTSCSSRIEEVRKYANYIKHKGGIDYKYLEAEPPMQLFFVPIKEDKNVGKSPEIPPAIPEEKYELKDFKSPVGIDIDEKLQTLVDAHSAILQSINETISDIDYERNSVQIMV